MMQQVRCGGAMALAATILLSSVLGAPQEVPKTSLPIGSSTSGSTTSTTTTTTTTAAAAAASARQTTTQRPTTTSSNGIFRSNLAAPIRVMNLDNSDDQQVGSIFDGKNPFSDESLWRIPIQLVRDSGVSNGPQEPLSKSASELKSSASTPANNGDHLSGDEASSLMDTDEEDSDETLNSASPTIISASTAPAVSDLKTAAGYHHASPHHGGYHAGHHNDYHGKYYQYASVPYPYAWEFGYRRGNPYHTIERHEHGKGPHFQTKVKWSDKHGGYGVHVWDYNHDDHHHGHHYNGHDSHHGYGHGEKHHGYGHH